VEVRIFSRALNILKSFMAGEQGFLYEGRVHNKLKTKKLVPSGFTPAGSDPNAPDAMFIYNGVPYKLEVKLDLRADYGQGTLEYIDGKWVLGGAQTAAAEELRQLMRAVGIEKFANREWGPKGAPNKGTIDNKDFTQAMVRSDYARFTDRFLSVPTKSLWNYYAAKQTYYIQIGGYGFYYMDANPAKLPVPQFTPTLRIRIRLKRGGSTPIYNYRFTTALQVVSKPSRSKYDIDKGVDFLLS
jgi:hypothetical protein